LHWLGRCSTAIAMPPVLFALTILCIESHVYAQASLYHNPPIYTSCVTG
jgi:hypothetical protein